MSEPLKQWRVVAVMRKAPNPDSKVVLLQIGTAITNRDGSINVYLDATPIDGRLKLLPEDES